MSLSLSRKIRDFPGRAFETAFRHRRRRDVKQAPPVVRGVRGDENAHAPRLYGRATARRSRNRSWKGRPLSSNVRSRAWFESQSGQRTGGKSWVLRGNTNPWPGRSDRSKLQLFASEQHRQMTAVHHAAGVDPNECATRSPAQLRGSSPMRRSRSGSPRNFRLSCPARDLSLSTSEMKPGKFPPS